VTWAIDEKSYSQRRACALVGLHPKTYRYASTRPDDLALRAKLRELASQRRRFGSRRLGRMLERQGIKLNAKKLYRLYKEERLARTLYRGFASLFDHAPPVRIIVRSSAAAPSPQTLSWAAFITAIAESNFRYTQPACYIGRRCKAALPPCPPRMIGFHRLPRCPLRRAA
jgi:hypothetical protein